MKKRVAKTDDEVVVLDPEDDDDSLPLLELPERTEPSEQTALVHVGALSLYLSEITRYPLLSRDEEYELAVHYKQTGDPEAAARMITSNLRLVVKIAMDFQRAFINVMDLIQEGNIGLMQAVAKFDPFKGVKLSSYAAWWIKAYILRYILNNWRMVKIGTTQAQRKLFFSLQKEKDRLESQGFVPTTKLLAERLDVSERDVIDMDARMSRPEISFDMPLSDDTSTTVGDQTPASGLLQDEMISRAQMEDIYDKALQDFESTLKDKELEIYRRRMMADPPATLQDIGDQYGVTRERVRQIEARILKKLKEYFAEHGIEPPG